jgi:hypothetical protein
MASISNHRIVLARRPTAQTLLKPGSFSKLSGLLFAIQYYSSISSLIYYDCRANIYIYTDEILVYLQTFTSNLLEAFLVTTMLEQEKSLQEQGQLYPIK